MLFSLFGGLRVNFVVFVAYVSDCPCEILFYKLEMF